MKIIHTADLHIGSSMSNSFDKDIAKKRRNELIESFKRLVDYANNNDITKIIIAGDMFDTKSISIEIQKKVLKILNINQHIEFFYLKGNHDETSFLYEQKLDNLKVFNEEWTYYNFDDVTIAGVVISSRNRNSLYNKLTLDSSCKNIVVLHGEPKENLKKADDDETILIDSLKDKNIDYIALGHIHKREEPKALGLRGYFANSGCLEGTGFDEEGVKGFLVIDTDKLDEKPLFVKNCNRIIFNEEIECSCKMTFDEYIKKVINHFKSLNATGDDIVKVKTTGKYDESFDKNIKELEEELLSRFYFAKVEDKSSLFVDPLVYQNDKSIKGTFVRDVLNSDFSDDEKSRIIETGIKAMKGEEF